MPDTSICFLKACGGFGFGFGCGAGRGRLRFGFGFGCGEDGGDGQLGKRWLFFSWGRGGEQVRVRVRARRGRRCWPGQEKVGLCFFLGGEGGRFGFGFGRGEDGGDGQVGKKVRLVFFWGGGGGQVRVRVRVRARTEVVARLRKGRGLFFLGGGREGRRFGFGFGRGALWFFWLFPLVLAKEKLKASIFMRLHLEGLCGHLPQGVVAGRPIVLRGSPCEARCDKVEQGIWWRWP